MAEIILSDVCKSYGHVQAVSNTSLRIAQGELVTFLGPSGCGKTTTLRMIGGFVDVTNGRIVVGGRDVTALPPAKRDMGFVFQNYALFPHMSVAQNVAFGLEMRRVPKPEMEQRVTAALRRVRLEAMRDRLPKQLSGGQQQRVALARALVIEPTVLLLDEPLSNLDAKLRHEMKAEIRNLQQGLNLTTIFVTHDQDEALSVSDRLVVMSAGRVEQIGTPREIYERPASAFVADFMGFANLLPVMLRQGGEARLACGAAIRATHEAAPGERLLALRAEHVTLSATLGDRAINALPVNVLSLTYRGGFIEYLVRHASGLTLTARGTADASFAAGADAFALWTPQAGALIPLPQALAQVA